MKKIALVATGLILALTGCGASDGGVQSPNEKSKDAPTYSHPHQPDFGDEGVIKHTLDGAYRDAYEFRLSDGTVCVLAGGDGGSGGVTCDWSSQ